MTNQPELLQLQQLAEEARTERDQTEKYLILRNLGDAYLKLDEYSNAIDSYEKALQTAEAIKDYQAESVIFGRLANVYLSLNDNERAIDYYNQGAAKSELIPQESTEFVEGGLIEAWAPLRESIVRREVYKRVLISILAILSSASIGFSINLFTSGKYIVGASIILVLSIISMLASIYLESILGKKKSRD